MWIARWVPWPTQGVGFSPRTGEMCSGEVPLVLDVEGRTGTVYLSRSMWAQIGAGAGWCSQAEADRIWCEETGAEPVDTGSEE